MGLLTKDEVCKIIDVYEELISLEPNIERQEILRKNQNEFEEYLIEFKFK